MFVCPALQKQLGLCALDNVAALLYTPKPHIPGGAELRRLISTMALCFVESVRSEYSSTTSRLVLRLYELSRNTKPCRGP